MSASARLRARVRARVRVPEGLRGHEVRLGVAEGRVTSGESWLGRFSVGESSFHRRDALGRVRQSVHTLKPGP